VQVVGDADASSDREWSDQTRRVLTRDLLLRATRSSSGEARALEFRALHLNLALIGELTEGLHLTGAQRLRAEHDGLEGLLEAVRRFDPFGEREFVEVAIPLIERRIRDGVDARTRLARRPVRLVVDHVPLAIVGPRT
jgi:DNA-directed RNA polymerase sigma subunit (sigma70/sigma32)